MRIVREGRFEASVSSGNRGVGVRTSVALSICKEKGLGSRVDEGEIG
jgi:hypothetical protein